MVMIKLVVVILVIVVGFFYIDIDNWTPFLPNGFGGVMADRRRRFFLACMLAAILVFSFFLFLALLSTEREPFLCSETVPLT